MSREERETAGEEERVREDVGVVELDEGELGAPDTDSGRGEGGGEVGL